MRSLQKNPSPRLLKGLLYKLVHMSPRAFVEYEPETIAEKMMILTLETAITEGRQQLEAFGAVWDRTDGPVNQRDDGGAELHIKIIGAPDVAPRTAGDLPYGTADREAAEERARIAAGNGSANGNGRTDLPGDEPGTGPRNGRS